MVAFWGTCDGLMAVVSNVSIKRDAILNLRGIIASGVTDPLTRTGDESFVMTTWPDRTVRYPVVIIQARLGAGERMGADTEAMRVPITLEAHVVSKDAKTLDILAGSIVDYVRSSQFGNSPISGTVNQDMNHFRFLNSIDLEPKAVDGDNPPTTRHRLHESILMFGYDYYTK